MGMFGGGGGSVDVSAGVNAIQQGTQQGLASLQKYYQEGVGYLNEGNRQAQAYIAPYGVAGSTALDELYDTLGMARPEGGSFGLQQALMNENKLSDLLNGTTGHPTFDPSVLKPQGPNAKTGNDSGGWMNGGGYIFDPLTGRFAEGADAWKGDYDVNSTNGKAITDSGLKPVQGADGKWTLQPVGGTAPVGLTPDQQKQWDLIQQYKAGSLDMTDPASMQAGVLAKLQATPGYQFMMQQGLQGVDRSASARGLLGSGAAIKQADQFSSGLAEQTYNNRVQSLAAAAGAGQQAMNSQQTNSGALGSALATLGGNLGSNTASLYGSQASGLAGLYGAQAQAQATQNASSNSLFGSIAGGVLGMFSDRRLKKNIIATGDIILDTVPVYEFSYVWDKDERHVGVMAQDILEVMPEAVGIKDGYYTVDYSKLGGL